MNSRLLPLALLAIALASTAQAAPLELESKIPLGEIHGRLDHLAIDLNRQRLYVAELGNDSVGVVDLKEPKTIRTLTGLKEPQGIGYVASADTLYALHANYPLALDASRSRLVAVFRRPAQMGVFDLVSGQRLLSKATCEDSDDVFLDPKRHRLYVICGEGMIETFAIDGDHYTSLGRIPTVGGARTALFAADLDRLFLAVRSSWSEPAAIWVFRPIP